MKTQSRKAKKHHNQINEGFVRYSFSEYVHRQGDEQFDEFLGLGKAWDAAKGLFGGAKAAAAPAAAAGGKFAGALGSAANDLGTGLRGAADKGLQAGKKIYGDAQKARGEESAKQAHIAKLKSRNVHLTRVEDAFDNIAKVLQKPQPGEDMSAISGMNVYVRDKLVPSLKTQFRAAMDKKWKLLDDATPNDVSRGGGMIRAQATNPSGDAPRGSGVPRASGSARDQIAQSARDSFAS